MEDVEDITELLGRKGVRSDAFSSLTVDKKSVVSGLEADNCGIVVGIIMFLPSTGDEEPTGSEL